MTWADLRERAGSDKPFDVRSTQNPCRVGRPTVRTRFLPEPEDRSCEWPTRGYRSACHHRCRPRRRNPSSLNPSHLVRSPDCGPSVRRETFRRDKALCPVELKNLRTSFETKRRIASSDSIRESL